MEKYLKNKKVLFVAPVFFGYEKDIQQELESKGAKVTFVGDNDFVWNQDNKTQNETFFKSKYDILFLIKGEYIDLEMIKLFINHNTNAQKIMYQYDSLDRFPHIVKMFPFFDRVYSFDTKDCKKYNLILRPLFFVHRKESNNNDFLYDISSVCSFYPDRMKLILAIKKSLKHSPIKFKHYVYYHWKSVLLNFFSVFIHLPNIKINPLPKSQMLHILRNSKAILDIPFEGQRGLTMRTFEAIGMQRKLITTNKSIIKYDFYNPNYIFVLDKTNINSISDFLNIESYIPDNQILNKYSIETFCKSMLCNLKLTFINEI